MKFRKKPVVDEAHEPDECSVCNPELAADMSARDEGYWEGWSDGQTVLRRDLMGILDLIEGPCANCKCEWCGGDHPDEECPRSPERHPVTGE